MSQAARAADNIAAQNFTDLVRDARLRHGLVSSSAQSSTWVLTPFLGVSPFEISTSVRAIDAETLDYVAKSKAALTAPILQLQVNAYADFHST